MDHNNYFAKTPYRFTNLFSLKQLSVNNEYKWILTTRINFKAVRQKLFLWLPHILIT